MTTGLPGPDRKPRRRRRLGRPVEVSIARCQRTREITCARSLAPTDEFTEKRAQAIAKGLAIAADALATARADAPPNSKSWEAWNGLGVALWMNGDALAAADAFNRARKLHPDRIYRSNESAALSTFEVDCRLALLSAPATPKSAKPPNAARTRKKR